MAGRTRRESTRSIRKESMSVWFEGEGEIACSLDRVAQAIDKGVGAYFTGVVSLMPGLTSVDLVEEHADAIVIKTNEGLMKRSNISTRVEDDRVTVEFDEEYQAGSKVTVNSHFVHEFVATDHGLTHQLAVRDVAAPGFLGFFYRKFGSSKMGTALLTAEKTYFETPRAP
jgi:hypothetical protein